MNAEDFKILKAMEIDELEICDAADINSESFDKHIARALLLTRLLNDEAASSPPAVVQRQCDHLVGYIPHNAGMDLVRISDLSGTQSIKRWYYREGNPFNHCPDCGERIVR